jgi:hypothetical protein
VKFGVDNVDVRAQPRMLLFQNGTVEDLIVVAARNCFWDLSEVSCRAIARARAPHLLAPGDSHFDVLRKLIHDVTGMSDIELHS